MLRKCIVVGVAQTKQGEVRIKTEKFYGIASRVSMECCSTVRLQAVQESISPKGVV
jgi:hypothetical protein